MSGQKKKYSEMKYAFLPSTLSATLFTS